MRASYVCDLENGIGDLDLTVRVLKAKKVIPNGRLLTAGTYLLVADEAGENVWDGEDHHSIGTPLDMVADMPADWLSWNDLRPGLDNICEDLHALGMYNHHSAISAAAVIREKIRRNKTKKS
jgi:hypothetical protein